MTKRRKAQSQSSKKKTKLDPEHQKHQLQLASMKKTVNDKIKFKPRHKFPSNGNLDNLDSLAKMLEGNSMCASVAFVNGKFLIACNEVTKKSNNDKNRHLKLFNLCMEYLASYANFHHKNDRRERRKFDKKYFKNVLAQIAYDAGILARKGPKFEDENKVLDKIKTTVINKLYQPYSLVELSTIYRNDLNLSHALGGAIAILVDFIHIKNEIRAENSHFTEAEKTAFKSTTEGYQILKTQTQHVHAEMQILQEIIKCVENKTLPTMNNTPQEINIGISKLCCLECRVMLETANIVFAAKGIPLVLKYQGENNIRFNWIPPAICREGYMASQEEARQHPKSLGFIIGFLAAQKIKQLIKTEEDLNEEEEAKKQLATKLIATPTQYDDRNRYLTHRLESTAKSLKAQLNTVELFKPDITLEKDALRLLKSRDFEIQLEANHSPMALYPNLCQVISKLNLTSKPIDILIFLCDERIFNNDVFDNATANYFKSIRDNSMSVLDTEKPPTPKQQPKKSVIRGLLFMEPSPKKSLVSKPEDNLTSPPQPT